MPGRVEGKVAFVTGAARGQGRSHAVRLAEEGADIIAVDLCAPIPGLQYPPATEEDLAETVRQVEALDRRIVARKTDTRDVSAMKAVIDEGVAQLGHLDIVVGNAGVCYIHSWDQATQEIWDQTISTNLTGAWNTVRLTAPHLIAAGGGSIILTSSAAGLKAPAIPDGVRRVEVRHHGAHEGLRGRARGAQHPRQLVAPDGRRHPDGRRARRLPGACRGAPAARGDAHQRAADRSDPAARPVERSAVPRLRRGALRHRARHDRGRGQHGVLTTGNTEY